MLHCPCPPLGLALTLAPETHTGRYRQDGTPKRDSKGAGEASRKGNNHNQKTLPFVCLFVFASITPISPPSGRLRVGGSSSPNRYPWAPASTSVRGFDDDTHIWVSPGPREAGPAETLTPIQGMGKLRPNEQN